MLSVKHYSFPNEPVMEKSIASDLFPFLCRERMYLRYNEIFQVKEAARYL